MRIFEAAQTSTNIKKDVEHVIERALHSTSGSPRHVEVEMILHRLGGAGYVIAHKDDLPAREPIEAPRLGTVALLTPEGERLVRAVETGDYVGVSERDFTAVVGLRLRLHGPDLRSIVAAFVGTPAEGVLRSAAEQEQRAVDLGLTPKEFTGPIKLERVEGFGAPQVYVDSTPGMSPWILKEVVPGEVLVQPYSDRTSACDHQVIVTAKAQLTRATSVDQRELTVRTAWICGEDAVEYSVGQALSLALKQAREAAAAFISATSPAPATDTEEAA